MGVEYSYIVLEVCHGLRQFALLISCDQSGCPCEKPTTTWKGSARVLLQTLISWDSFYNMKENCLRRDAPLRLMCPAPYHLIRLLSVDNHPLLVLPSNAMFCVAFSHHRPIIPLSNYCAVSLCLFFYVTMALCCSAALILPPITAVLLPQTYVVHNNMRCWI